MKNLTLEQIDFLNSQNISLDKVFDATGYSQGEYRLIMKDLGKQIAFNVTPCQQFGHTLRTRAGHCIQCNTAAIAFIKRNDSEGIVYIAGTQKGKIIKIGYTKKASIRNESLNRTKYAGFNDWQILFAIESSIAGQIEAENKSAMLRYSRGFGYNHEGHQQESGETYTCSYSKAKTTLLDLCKNRNHHFSIQTEIKSDSYEFRNLMRLK